MPRRRITILFGLCLVLALALPTMTFAQDSPDVAPFYITTMTHMESNFIDDIDENVFWNHVEQLRFGMDIADEFNAVLTVESEQPFSRANVIWEHNMMQEILDRGHGVGTHCDIGFRDPIMPVEDYAAMFSENKQFVDALVGEENNRGCSGGGSRNDYVLAASMAGFDYLNGIVSMHYLSMPIENRPSPEWTDEYIFNGNHHDNAPVDITEQVYPFMVADATRFTPDEDGILLISAGDLGTINNLHETEIGMTCPRNCALTREDADIMIEQIRDIISWQDNSRMAKLTIYFPVNTFVERNEDGLRYFFAEVALLIADSDLEWASQLDAYEAYIAWNGLD